MSTNKVHAENIRRQIYALLVVVALTVGAVALVAVNSGTTSAAQPSRQNAPESDP